jgi:hypothetical protein
VPDVRGVSAKQRKSITDAFATLCQRPIGNVFDEVKQSDRKALDRAVLSAIGLDPKQYLQPIYDGLCELVSERIELGRQRGNARKTKARKVIAEREIFTQVLDEALPEGPSRFPDDFFSAAAAAEEKTAVELPTGELTLNTDPFAMGVYTRTGGCIRHIKAPAEGKFLIYAQQAGHITALLPAKLVEVTRTVANYESYLRDLRKRLYDSYYRRSLNVGVAARLTQASWDQLHLPSIDT